MKLTTSSCLVLLAASATRCIAAPSFSYSTRDNPVTRSQPRSEPAARQQQGPQLYPAVHPQLNKRDIQHLEPRDTAQLFYTTPNGSIYLQNGQMVATLDALFHWDAVILDHSLHVSNVTCKYHEMDIQFDSLQPFNSAKANWTRDDTIVFVSSAKSCHTRYPGQYGYFNTSSVTFDQGTLTAVARGRQITVKDAVKEYNLVWGEWEAAGSPINPANALKTSSSSSTVPTKSTSSSLSKSTSSSSSSSSSKSTSSSSSKSTSSSSSKSTSSSSSKSTTSSASSSSSKSTSSTAPKSTSSSASKSTPSPTTKTSSASNKTPTKSSSSSTPTKASKSSSSSAAHRLHASITSTGTTTTSTAEAFPTLSYPSGVGKCGVVPTPIPSGISQYFTQIPCDNGFDQAVDDFFTYLSDVSNLNPYLTLWAPNTGITSTDIPTISNNLRLARRGRLAKRGLLDDVVDIAIDVIDVVVDVVEAAIDAVKDLAETLLPTWNPSVTFTIPVDLEIPESLLDESPWGDAYEIYKYIFGEEEGEFAYQNTMGTLAKLTGAEELLTFDIDGVTQEPVPGVTVYCVDCGITGSMKTTGAATFTIAGPTHLTLTMDGSLDALLQLGVDAFYEWEKDLFDIRILEFGVPGFSIPDIVAIGPYMTLDLDSTIKVEALGQILAGLNLTWPKIGGTIDFMDPSKTKAYGFAPQIQPVFDVYGQVTVTASVGLPVGFAIGVDLLDGDFELAVALVDRPAIQAVAEYETDPVPACGNLTGISFYSNLVNELKLHVLNRWKYDLGSWEGPKFFSGCLNSNGVKLDVIQAQPPIAGKSRFGCPLPDDAFQNGNFDSATIEPWQSDGDASMDVDGEELKFHLDPVQNKGFHCLACFSCSGFGNSVSLDCDGCCPPPPASYTRTIEQPINNFCTYAQYDLQVSSRVVSGGGYCNITKAYLKSDAEPRLNQDFPINQVIHVANGNAPGNLPLNNYVPITIPSYDQTKNNYPVSVGIEVTCFYTSDFDVRLDDFQLQPDASALAGTKRSVEPGSKLISARSTHEARKAQELSERKKIPVIPPGNSAPALPPANALPTIPSTQSVPVLSAANGAPTIPAANEAPAFSYVPEANVVTGTVLPGDPIPTATASLIGPADYVFPPFATIMAATYNNAAGGGAPSSSEPFTGWGTITDLTNTNRLATADDGNFYLVSNSGPASPGTKFYSENSIAWKDEAQRLFHYYPETMNTYGVSRLRVSDVLDTPLTAQLITLAPTLISGSNIYVAADTNHGNFFLAWCSAPFWQGSKVFLVADYADSLTKLLSGDVQWIVTGANVTECHPLILDTAAQGLTPS